MSRAVGLALMLCGILAGSHARVQHERQSALQPTYLQPEEQPKPFPFDLSRSVALPCDVDALAAEVEFWSGPGRLGTALSLYAARQSTSGGGLPASACKALSVPVKLQLQVDDPARVAKVMAPLYAVCLYSTSLFNMWNAPIWANGATLGVHSAKVKGGDITSTVVAWEKRVKAARKQCKLPEDAPVWSSPGRAPAEAYVCPDEKTQMTAYGPVGAMAVCAAHGLHALKKAQQRFWHRAPSPATLRRIWPEHDVLPDWTARPLEEVNDPVLFHGFTKFDLQGVGGKYFEAYVKFEKFLKGQDPFQTAGVAELPFVAEKSFFSLSRSSVRPAHFMTGPVPALVAVLADNAPWIAPWSTTAHEDEFLLPPGTELVVLALFGTTASAKHNTGTFAAVCGPNAPAPGRQTPWNFAVAFAVERDRLMNDFRATQDGRNTQEAMQATMKALKTKYITRLKTGLCGPEVRSHRTTLNADTQMYSFLTGMGPGAADPVAELATIEYQRSKLWDALATRYDELAPLLASPPPKKKKSLFGL